MPTSTRTDACRISSALTAAVMCLPLIGAGTAPAEWEQIYKLNAEDASEGNTFGLSVAIGEDIVAVGAPRADVSGVSCGAVYVFDLTGGRQKRRFTADVPIQYSLMGESVAVSGSTIVAGMPVHDPGGGSAFLFNVTTGEQTYKLKADDAETGDTFGKSAAIHGSGVVVGAPWRSDGGMWRTGAAYLFDAETGSQLFKLTAPDATEGIEFGISVAINESSALVATLNAVYVFDAESGEFLRKLTPEGVSSYVAFGRSIDMDDQSTAVIGAPGNTEVGGWAGAAYIFDVATGEQLHRLVSHDSAPYDRFGRGVAISGDKIIIGAPGEQNEYPYFIGGAGKAYLFDTATGEELSMLTSEDEQEGDQLGTAVGIRGDLCIAGAHGGDDACPYDPFCDSGSAYVFHILGTSCPADINGDGVVDVLDLLAVLSAWGPCEPDGPEDINEDGTVDVLDLLEVLNAWGPCF